MPNRRKIMLLLKKVTDELSAHAKEALKTQRLGRKRVAEAEDENLLGHLSVPDLESMSDPIITARATGRRNKATARVASLRK